jgi:flavin reductase (DIM6/NTAB) family NADH-FMN oxidoreductase RutF
MDKKAMYDIGYGLYVLTAKDEEKVNGCIINTAVQVTSNPNRISIAVNKQNLTHDMILKNHAFNLSIIGQSAGFELFERFGFHTGRDTDKFAGFDQPRSITGIPYITKGTTAWMSGWVEQTIDLGTHTLFIAAVTDAEKLANEPTMTYTYYQQNVKSKPEMKKDEKGWRCSVCGYVYEQEDLPEDFVCPLCKHGACDFEKIC